MTTKRNMATEAVHLFWVFTVSPDKQSKSSYYIPSRNNNVKQAYEQKRRRLSYLGSNSKLAKTKSGLPWTRHILPFFSCITGG